MLRNLLIVAVATLLLVSCVLLPVTLGPAITDTAGPVVPPPGSATPLVATIEPLTATPPPLSQQLQFIAYVQDGQLLVTDVTNGIVGGTTQYTAAGQSDKVSDLVWSPSGEFVAFVSAATGDPHVFYIYAEGASTPTDLGPGSSPAWAPDSTSIAYIGGTYPNENIFITPIDNPAPRQLTSETNHAWGRPAFMPDGQSLVVTSADHNDMGAQGNTTFTLEQLPLDGSGTLTPMPGASSLEGVRLPYDLHFSPDGSKLAFSTSGHLSACASPGSYYIHDVASGARADLTSPSLRAALDPSKELYYVGLSYAWMPSGDAIVASGTVVNCDMNSPNMGKAVAGPQLSVIRLDGSEGTIIPGMFWSPSVDRTGKLIAAAHYQDLGDPNPTVEIFSADGGQLLVKLGPGSKPQLQP